MATKRKPGGRLNAVRDGIFAKELVITSAGESQQEFDRLRSRLWNNFSPQDVAREMLVEQLAITYWRLERPRRCEAAEIRKQTETARCRKELAKIAQLNGVKNKFFSARYRLHLEANLSVEDRLALERSLAEIRRSLESTALGVEFLIKQLNALKSEVRVYGYLRPHMETLLLQACGLEADHLHGFLQFNQLAKNEIQKLHPPENKQVEQNGKDAAEQYSQTFRTSEMFKMMMMAVPPKVKQKEEGKVQLRENDQVEQTPGKAAEKNARSISEAENIARAREFVEFAVGAMEKGKQDVLRMIKRLTTENSTETGMGANGGGELFEDLCTLYQENDEMLQFLHEYQEKWVEDEANSANEEAVLNPVEANRLYLLQVLDTHIELVLTPRKKQLELLEAAEEASEPATLLLLPPESQDRIHRAEITLQRYFLKILDRLCAPEG